MDAGTSREGRLLGDASRIDGHSLDWSLERLVALYRYARPRFAEKGDNPQLAGFRDAGRSYNRGPDNQKTP